MKAQAVKTFLDLHTWTGLAAGMALFIAFYAGAMTVFFHELEVWESYGAPVAVAQAPEQAQQLVDLVVGHDPRAAESLRLYPSSEDHPGHVVRWFERLEDDTFEGHEYRLAADGTLSTEASEMHLASFIYLLHYTAGLPSSFGLYVLGIVCFIYGLALISGLMVFLPNLMKDLFIVRKGRNTKRFWLDAHNVVGVVSLPWHLMFAWSSVLLAVGLFVIAPYQYLLFDEDLIQLLGPELGAVQPLEPTGVGQAALPVTDLMAIAEREAPGMTVEQVRYANLGDKNAMVSILGQANTSTMDSRATVALNATTGEVLAVAHPDTAGVGATFYSGLVALHFANFGGYIVKWIYFLLGLAGAFLFYSGNLLWVETRRKRRQAEQPGTGLFLARLNSGVCIGCMTGISAAFLASRALAGTADPGAMTEVLYYSVFLGAIAWCFLRSVASGARDLLYLCAGLTALIPVADALYAGMPLWRSVAMGEWAIVCVNVMALLAALVFWRLGRAVQRRATAGDPNSVWAERASGGFALPWKTSRAA